MLARRLPIAPLEYTRRLWLRSWVGLVALFLYAPLLVLLIFSFNDSKRNVVWKGFTLKYYEQGVPQRIADGGVRQFADHRLSRHARQRRAGDACGGAAVALPLSRPRR